MPDTKGLISASSRTFSGRWISPADNLNMVDRMCARSSSRKVKAGCRGRAVGRLATLGVVVELEIQILFSNVESV